MAQTLPSAPTCGQCSAPLGVSDRRCPFCGAEYVPPLSVRPAAPESARPGAKSPSSIPPGELVRGPVSYPGEPSSSRSSRPSVVPPPFSGGQVGILNYNNDGRDRAMAAMRVPPVRHLPSPMTIVGGLALLAMIGFGGWSIYLSKQPPPPPAVLPKKPPPIPAVMSSIGVVAVPDADRADPTEVLGEVQRKVAPGDAGASLVSITIVGSSNGVVDLRKPGRSVTYLYASGRAAGATATLVPRGQPLAGREGRQLVLQLNGGQPETVPLPKGAQPVPEPLCVWGAAWRTAVKSGVPEDAEASGVYAMKGNEPRWVITVAGKPEYTRELDGKSCAIKTR